MSNFLEASRIKLRVGTTSGVLSVEQLWDLKPTQLAVLIKASSKSLKASDSDDDTSFLDETKTVDKVEKLRFDILKEIYLVKKAEADEAKAKADNKAHNAAIDALIFEKQADELKSKSIEELKALRK